MLREGLRLVGLALGEGDRTTTRELTFANATVLDLEIEELPGAMP